jgi:hypothetical protein
MVGVKGGGRVGGARVKLPDGCPASRHECHKSRSVGPVTRRAVAKRRRRLCALTGPGQRLRRRELGKVFGGGGSRSLFRASVFAPDGGREWSPGAGARYRSATLQVLARLVTIKQTQLVASDLAARTVEP